LKATNTDIVLGKYPSAELHFSKRNSIFEDTKNDPTITTILPLNHRIDFAAIENINQILSYKLTLSFFVVNCHKSLQCLIIRKIALKQDNI